MIFDFIPFLKINAKQPKMKKSGRGRPTSKSPELFPLSSDKRLRNRQFSEDVFSFRIH